MSPYFAVGHQRRSELPEPLPGRTAYLPLARHNPPLSRHRRWGYRALEFNLHQSQTAVNWPSGQGGGVGNVGVVSRSI